MKKNIFYLIFCVFVFCNCKSKDSSTTVCELYQNENPTTYNPDCGCRSDRFQIDELCPYKRNEGYYLTTKFSTNVNSSQKVNRILFYLDKDLSNYVTCNKAGFGDGESPKLSYIDSKQMYQTELNMFVDLGSYGYRIELDIAKGADLSKLSDIKGRILWIDKNSAAYPLNDPIIENVTFKIYKQ
jgi:hypothetical protein